MKVAQVIASGGWGGRERVPLLLAKGLRRAGVHVEVWADPEFPLAREAAAVGVPVFSFRHRGYLRPGGVRAFLRLLSERRPDVVHLHHSKDLWAAVPALALTRSRIPLVLSKHVGSRVRKKDPLHRLLYARVDRLLGNSEFLRRNLLETCPVGPEKVGVAHPPVDLEAFRFRPAARSRLRRLWRAGRRPVVAMVSRLTPGKGLEILLRAAAILQRRGSTALFRLAGGTAGEERGYASKLEALRESLGLREVFAFEGHVRDVAGFLSAADVVAHAAAAETFGMAVVEALACGRPAAARESPGTAEILSNAGSRGEAPEGVLVPSDDPGDWARALESLLASPARLMRARRYARRTSRRFSLQASVRRHLAEYGRLLSPSTASGAA